MEQRAAFCSTLPFSTLEHHWWHVQLLKLLANRLFSFALSPCIIGVKGRCSSQLMSQRAPLFSPRTPPAALQTPTIQWETEIKQKERELFFSTTWASVELFVSASVISQVSVETSPSWELFIFNTLISLDGQISAEPHCKFPVPLVVTVHPCNQIMPAEGSGTKTCKF